MRHISKKIIFFIVLLCASYIYPRVFVNPITGDSLTDLIKKIAKTMCEARCDVGTLIKEPVTIYEPGSYFLGDTISGNVTIASDDVWLDLNCFGIEDNTGTTTTVIVEQGYRNIVVKNGYVKGSGGASGILLGQGSGLVTIEDVQVYDFESGIFFDGATTGTVKDCKVKECTIFDCNKGVVGNYLVKTTFENVESKNCFESGFELGNSQYNIFDRCRALDISNGDVGKNAIGFKAAGGRGNLFYECVAEGIVKTAQNLDAIGFLLTGEVEVDSEQESKIVNCIVNSVETLGTGTAYGISLELTTTLCKVESNNISNVSGIGLSGDSFSSLIIKNICYECDTPFGDNITNLYAGGLDGDPSNIINIAIPPYTDGESTNPTVDSMVDVLDEKIDTVDSKLDDLVDESITIGSKVDFLIPCCLTVNSKVDLVIEKKELIDSKVDLVVGLSSTIDSKIDIVDDKTDTIDSVLDIIKECCTTVDSKIDCLDDIADTVDSKIDVINLCCDTVDSKVDILESKVDVVVNGAICEVITTSTMISVSGCYKLGNNIEGSIIIDSDAVTLCLNGFEVYESDTTGTAIVVETGHKEIEIKNGSVRGGYDGLLIKQGSRAVTLEDIRIKDCENGIHVDGASGSEVTCCKIKDCILFENNNGLSANHAIKCTFENCKACNCLLSGFSLTESNFNCFKQCCAVKTENNNLSQDAVGFSTTGGIGNMFYECISHGTKKLNSDFGYNAVGFLLNGTSTISAETKTKIMHCIANSTMAAGGGNAYGIFLDFEIKSSPLSSILTTTDHGATLYTVDWSPEAGFLAVGGAPATDGTNVKIYKCNGSELSLIVSLTVGDQNVNSVAWSPDGESLVVAADVSSSFDEIFVYQFDQSAFASSGRLLLLDSINTNRSVYSAAWSANGRFIAFGLDSGSSNELQVYRFDGTDFSNAAVGTSAVGFDVKGVDFSQDDLFLSVVYSTTLELFAFDQFDTTNALTSKTSIVSSVGNVVSVDFSPTSCKSKYFIAVSGDGVTNQVQVFEYDGQTSVSSVDVESHGADVDSVKWSPNGKYLFAAGDASGGNELRMYSFDGTNLTSEATGNFVGGNANSGDWSPSGQYVVAVGETTSGNDIAIFDVASVPTKCLIKNNDICNSSGGLGGIGLSGASGRNMIARNIGYDNDINFGPGVFNVYVDGLNGTPDNAMDNISVPPYDA